MEPLDAASNDQPGCITDNEPTPVVIETPIDIPVEVANSENCVTNPCREFIPEAVSDHPKEEITSSVDPEVSACPPCPPCPGNEAAAAPVPEDIPAEGIVEPKTDAECNEEDCPVCDEAFEEKKEEVSTRPPCPEPLFPICHEHIPPCETVVCPEDDH